MTDAIRVAATPLSWQRTNGALSGRWEDLLDQVTGLGFSWMELGPLGLLPEDATVLSAELQRRGIGIVGATRFLWLRDPAKRGGTMEIVHRTGRLLTELQATHLILIDRPDGTTGPGGAPEPVDVTEHLWDDVVNFIDEIVDTARSTYGLRVAVHPHFGSAVFREEELDRLMSRLNETELDLCLDTGHALWAGMDPVRLFERYRSRIATVHLRDVRSINSTEACGLGEGIYDFSNLIQALNPGDFAGWVTVDQDPIPARPSRAVATRNIAYLDSVGLKLS
ncbi:MAG: sugar phosphate isomerase/epimerase family protein [Actinomycetota bacterium]